MSATPYTNAVAVTPSDSTPISETAALYIGSVSGGATLKVTMAGAGNTVVAFAGLTAGSILPIAVKQVFATGTLASSIIALR